ncbi:MAG: class I SAM-dependent methyltransferase [Alphaproteobacteria bacterium]|nr:class I SAM-dependent methyltransferase [Alphaproteobacteria bacterium]
MSEVDFGRAAEDYGTHRQGFPARFYARILDQGVGRVGQRILDIGTGTGTVARRLAAGGAAVTGLDPSAAMLAQARALATREGVAVDFVQGSAEQTGLPGGHFDAVVAAQCWHWFDGRAAAAEVRRLLRPGGRVLIAHLDWLPLAGNVMDAVEALMRRFNPTWALAGSTGIYPRWLVHLGEAGFTELETASFDLDLLYRPAAWRGRVRASSAVAASLPPDAVARFDAAHAALLAERFPADPLPVPHRVWWVTGVSPA